MLKISIRRKVTLIIILCAATILAGCGKSNSSVNVYTTSIQSAAVSSSEFSSDVQSQKTTVVYSNDPKNACSITFDGFKIIVSGKYSDVFAGVREYNTPMNIESSFDGDTLTCTLTPKNEKNDKYGWFYILDANNYLHIVNIEFTENGIKLPDVSDVVRGNDKVTNTVVELSEAQTAKYITLDGSRDKIPQILDEIQKISDEICEGIDSDYEKLRAISHWVSEYLYYDYPAEHNGIPQECLSLEYMLNNRSSVCGGYSNLTSALCAAQGIRCLNIIGKALNDKSCFAQGVEGGLHEWNVAEIDGEKIILDSGWDSMNTFGTDGTFETNSMCFENFNIGKEVFSLNHKAQTAEYRDYQALIK